MRSVIADIIAGRVIADSNPKAPLLPPDKAHSTTTLGLGMIPDVLESTPAYVDRIIPMSPAAKADVRPDDLVLLVANTRIENQKKFTEALRAIDRRDPVVLTVQRDSRIVSIKIEP